MEHQFETCPPWLAGYIKGSGGSVSFQQYMDWVLNDPSHGFYANGKLKIGKNGDFVTSPSLGSDFAELLAIQLVQWFEIITENNTDNIQLSLVEIGPGEGDLVYDLIQSIEELSPNIFKLLEFVLVETNFGMYEKQKNKLSKFSDVPIYWRSLDDLVESPVLGVIIAHELLDAFPVERVVLAEDLLYRQGVKLIEDSNLNYLSFDQLPLNKSLDSAINKAIKEINITFPPINTNSGWTTEWHVNIRPWLNKVHKVIKSGPLLIIDYALEAKRYYHSNRINGTMLAYKGQVASTELLKEPGSWDLTSHLCLDTLFSDAQACGWSLLGEVRQGQALLALGLSEKLHSLNYVPNHQIEIALQRRESLLRLVDPICLGEFRWIAFIKDSQAIKLDDDIKFRSIFLEDPSN